MKLRQKTLVSAMFATGAVTVGCDNLLEDDRVGVATGALSNRVAYCHLLGNGDYVVIEVDDDASDAHRRHGDRRADFSSDNGSNNCPNNNDE